MLWSDSYSLSGVRILAGIVALLAVGPIVAGGCTLNFDGFDAASDAPVVADDATRDSSDLDAERDSRASELGPDTVEPADTVAPDADDRDAFDTGSTPRYCAQQCSRVGDCVDKSQLEPLWDCTRGICDPDFCQNDFTCTRLLSQWTKQGCSSGDCADGKECIVHGMMTFCAHTPGTDGCKVGSNISKSTPDGREIEACVHEGTCADPPGFCAALDPRKGCPMKSCPNGGTCENGRCVCSPGECNDEFTCVAP